MCKHCNNATHLLLFIIDNRVDTSCATIHKHLDLQRLDGGDFLWDARANLPQLNENNSIYFLPVNKNKIKSKIKNIINDDIKKVACTWRNFQHGVWTGNCVPIGPCILCKQDGLV